MERRQLEEMIDDGMSVSDMARALDRSRSMVGYWLEKHDLEVHVRRDHGPRGPLNREDLKALVNDDLSVAEIAQRIDRSRTTVRYWLQRHGLETTPVARAKVGGRRLPRTLVECEKHGPTEHVVRGDHAECTRCRSERVADWRRRAKQILVAEAGGRCGNCGYDRALAALQFHHTDPATKSFGLGGRGLAQSLDKLRAEASKCVLLCANCHAEVEAGITRLP